MDIRYKNFTRIKNGSKLKEIATSIHILLHLHPFWNCLCHVYLCHVKVLFNPSKSQISSFKRVRLSLVGREGIVGVGIGGIVRVGRGGIVGLEEEGLWGWEEEGLWGWEEEGLWGGKRRDCGGGKRRDCGGGKRRDCGGRKRRDHMMAANCGHVQSSHS